MKKSFLKSRPAVDLSEQVVSKNTPRVPAPRGAVVFIGFDAEWVIGANTADDIPLELFDLAGHSAQPMEKNHAI